MAIPPKTADVPEFAWAKAQARADMAEKLAELLANAVAMVDRDVIRVRPSERKLLTDAISEWNEALAEWDALEGE